MADLVTFDLKVKPHVGKFLRYYYGEYLTLYRGDHVCNHLEALIKMKVTRARYEQALSNYQDSVKIKITPDKIFERKVRNINGFVTVRFNEFVNDLFWHEFFQYMDNTLMMQNIFKTKFEKQYLIGEFMNKFDLDEEEDLKTNSFEVAYRRYLLKKPQPTSTD